MSKRPLPEELANALQEGQVELFYLFEILAPTPIRLYSGSGVMSWNGHPWSGLNGVGEISGIRETKEIRANELQMQVSSQNELLDDFVRNVAPTGPRYRSYTYIGALRDGVIEFDPIIAFGGWVDTASIESDGLGEFARVVVESRLVDMGRRNERRYTDQDQRARFPTDRFFEHLNGVATRDYWFGGQKVPRASIVDRSF